ncbi:type II toxin-antitoxin system VapC family toxin [Chenggangzhangella methanolivorans]|uniref:Type II toxin-antitoxin system VapC family toxin n=1 Tax=Chenggangzhangella methanolivorans TaxID=1437009 RepID=A0A9E6RI95_9HYPH|nr:type II toxin-antitoxin system VapC family toxin [Chenggangzhangella methanolivorans]QZO01507.1 type II toxin-antitoxin system VapC family toxin [Chenggangzhangella methanolivorans]
MSQPILLDTCAVIWIAEDAAIAKTARAELDAALDDGVPVMVSAMTAWEIGLLAARGRLILSLTPERWFSRFVSSPGVELAPLSANVLIASSYLPGDPPSDPADRIIAATARDLGARLMTRDRLLLSYGELGHLATIAC